METRSLALPLALLAATAALPGFGIAAPPSAAATSERLPVLIVDGVNNHDWAAATRFLRTTLEGSGRFRVDVATWPDVPADFSKYRAVINNFNGGHSRTGQRWTSATERALVDYVRNGGGLVVFHAANNAFLEWSEYNDMIGLGWRDKSFGPGIAIGPGGSLLTVPQGAGLGPGHGPRQDFDVFVLDKEHPITRGLPARWRHPSEQLTHGQHGPARELTVLTYAYSEVSRQGEPMDWVRPYGKGRVYTTMLGHTWKDEPSPNLDDVYFQALVARGVEWAAAGKVTLAADLGWRALFNGRNLDGWETRGPAQARVIEGGILAGMREHGDLQRPFADPWPVTREGYSSWLWRQAWLYTKEEFGEFDLHLEYWLPPGGNSGVSIRDRSRAHHVVGEADAERPDLAAVLPRKSPAYIGYEIQIIDNDRDPFPSGSVYTFVKARRGPERKGEWNAMDIEARDAGLRIRVNGELVAEFAGEPGRSKTGPVGLQLHDQFTWLLFRNLRIREWK